MDAEEYRLRERTARRAAEDHALEMDAAPTEKKVRFGKDDKEGVTVSINEPPEWVKEFLDKGNRRRQPPEKPAEGAKASPFG
mmetsp:Transcript_29901/g.73578  ORF Transcript_29901/g.73578 Transcript_29901/m.73578 type:complete len:82 (+) Transcript_29901:246-491(+)